MAVEDITGNRRVSHRAREFGSRPCVRHHPWSTASRMGTEHESVRGNSIRIHETAIPTGYPIAGVPRREVMRGVSSS